MLSADTCLKVASPLSVTTGVEGRGGSSVVWLAQVGAMTGRVRTVESVRSPPVPYDGGHPPSFNELHQLTSGMPPKWVSARPKRFASSLVMSLAMTLITNVRSRARVCLGCQLHRLLVVSGWARADQQIALCGDGSCATVRHHPPGDRSTHGSCP